MANDKFTREERSHMSQEAARLALESAKGDPLAAEQAREIMSMLAKDRGVTWIGSLKAEREARRTAESELRKLRSALRSHLG